MYAEAAAARDSNALTDQIAEIISELDTAHHQLVDFSEKWQAGEPPHDFDNFPESTQRLLSYSNARRFAYQRGVAPGVTAVIAKAEAVLGERDPRVLMAKHEAMAGPTNYIGMGMLADQLQVLRVALSLR